MVPFWSSARKRHYPRCIFGYGKTSILMASKKTFVGFSNANVMIISYPILQIQNTELGTKFIYLPGNEFPNGLDGFRRTLALPCSES